MAAALQVLTEDKEAGAGRPLGEAGGLAGTVQCLGQGEGPVGCAAGMRRAWILLGAGRMLVGPSEGVFCGA